MTPEDRAAAGLDVLCAASAQEYVDILMKRVERELRERDSRGRHDR